MNISQEKLISALKSIVTYIDNEIKECNEIQIDSEDYPEAYDDNYLQAASSRENAFQESRRVILSQFYDYIDDESKKEFYCYR